MEALFASVFLASLLGSVHCVGMCGPLMLIATQGTQGAGSSSRGTGTLYHGGRALSYAALGLAAGGFGAGMDWGGALFGFQRIALTLSAGFLVGLGLWQIARVRGWVPSLGHRGTRTAHRGLAHWRAQVMRWPAARRSFAMGGLSGLLPCGWLFAFVAVAAGSGSAWMGAGLMLAFWLGSVPLLATFAGGAGRIWPRLQARFPLLTPLLLIAAGIFVLQGRAAVTRPDWQTAAQEHQPEQALQQALSEEPSCCAGKTEE